jgi:threonine synthase
MPAIAYLECSRCHAHLSATTPQTVCKRCSTQPAGSLYVRYDLSALNGSRPQDVVQVDGPGWQGMWRYRAVLPDVTPVTLGEGWTPMLRSKRFPEAYLKEEGANPTGTFKARGLAMAVSMVRHYGLRKLAVPSAGNAAGALAAYSAAAGIEAHIFMPRDVPFANYVEATAYGANVTLVSGLISDCAEPSVNTVCAYLVMAIPALIPCLLMLLLPRYADQSIPTIGPNQALNMHANASSVEGVEAILEA